MSEDFYPSDDEAFSPPHSPVSTCISENDDVGEVEKRDATISVRNKKAVTQAKLAALKKARECKRLKRLQKQKEEQERQEARKEIQESKHVPDEQTAPPKRPSQRKKPAQIVRLSKPEPRRTRKPRKRVVYISEPSSSESSEAVPSDSDRSSCAKTLDVYGTMTLHGDTGRARTMSVQVLGWARDVWANCARRQTSRGVSPDVGMSSVMI